MIKNKSGETACIFSKMGCHSLDYQFHLVSSFQRSTITTIVSLSSVYTWIYITLYVSNCQHISLFFKARSPQMIPNHIEQSLQWPNCHWLVFFFFFFIVPSLNISVEVWRNIINSTKSFLQLLAFRREGWPPYLSLAMLTVTNTPYLKFVFGHVITSTLVCQVPPPFRRYSAEDCRVR